MTVKKTLEAMNRTWEFLVQKPMTLPELSRALRVSEYHAGATVAMMIENGSAAKMPFGRFRATDEQPGKRKRQERDLDVVLKKNRMAPLSVPNSIWQMHYFV